MSKKSSAAVPKTNQGSGKGSEHVQHGYVAVEKGGYTPVATTSKLPRPPKGGTGQSSLKPSAQPK